MSNSPAENTRNLSVWRRNLAMRERTILVLRGDGYSVREIASFLNVSAATTHRILKDAGLTTPREKGK